MAVKAVKAKKKNGPAEVKPRLKKNAGSVDWEAWITQVENDPNAPLIAKDVAAYWRVRDNSGEPYLTIEQIQAELERE